MNLAIKSTFFILAVLAVINSYASGLGQLILPIRLEPINQYECLYVKKSNGVNLFTKRHFNFPVSVRPLSALIDEQEYICHDILRYGRQDSPTIPRLNIKIGTFSLWSKSDRAFLDLNGNGNPDVNDYIRDRLATEYGIIANVNLFQANWGMYSPFETNSLNGFFFVPFVDPRTGFSFCPSREHYFGNDPIFRILFDVLLVETQGVYQAKREPLSWLGDDGSVIVVPDDYLIVNETDLKRVWFYNVNGRHYTPDELTVRERHIHFYYPFDFNDPYRRKVNQRKYTIVKSSITPTHDSRFGCVPKL